MNMLALTIIILLIIAGAFTWGYRWGLNRGFRKGYKSGYKVGEGQGFVKALRTPDISNALRTVETKMKSVLCVTKVRRSLHMPKDEITALLTLTVYELCTKLGTALLHSGVATPKLIKTERCPNGDTVDEIGLSVYATLNPAFDGYPTADYTRRNKESIW